MPLRGTRRTRTRCGRRGLPSCRRSCLLESIGTLRKRREDMGRLLKEVSQGAYAYEPMTLDDFARAAQVERKFVDLGLGVVDASSLALAERLDVRRILTIDADLSAVRMGKRWRATFELVVPIG